MERVCRSESEMMASWTRSEILILVHDRFQLTAIVDVHGAILVHVEVLRRFGHFNPVRRLLFCVLFRVLIDELDVNEVAIKQHRLIDERPRLLLGQWRIERSRYVAERQTVVFIGAELQAALNLCGRYFLRLFTRRRHFQ